MVPTVFSDLFLVERMEPLAERSSWACVAPWMPEAKPLATVFLAYAVLVQIFIQVVLFRRKPSGVLPARGPLSQINLVRLAFGMFALGAAAEALLAAVEWSSLSLWPIMSMLWGIVMTVVLVRERTSPEGREIRR